MADIVEESVFHAGIYELALTDPVLGGVDGVSNLPLKLLTDRTRWLKDAIDNLESGGGPFEFNASAGILPSGGSDGPGTTGIRRKDYYFVTVAGTVSGVTLQIGDALIAKVDDAAVIGDFIVSQSNAELATSTVIGMIKLVQNISGGSLTDACLSVAGLISLFAKINSPSLTGAPATTTPGDTDNSTRIANTAWVLARLVELNSNIQDDITAEATARANADGVLNTAITAEATARANADSVLNTAITAEATARANADTALLAAIPVVKILGTLLTLNLPAGGSSVDILVASLPGIKVGFWCTVTIDASGSDVGVLTYTIPGLSGQNILRQVDTGYAGNPNNSEFSWFCPLRPGNNGRFSMGHYVGSTAFATIRIVAYL